MFKFEKSHPRAFKCWKLVDTPQKVSNICDVKVDRRKLLFLINTLYLYTIQVKKFLVGRQFFVIFVVFLIAQITSFPKIPKNFVGMPALMTTILVQTGLPGIALVLTFGQLVSQIYVEEFTLQFLNLIGCEFVIRLSLAAEWIGICNFSWFLYHASSFLCCRKVEIIENEIKSNKSWENIIENGPDDAQRQQPMSPTEKNRGKDYKSVTAFDDVNPKTFFEFVKYLWSTFATLGSLFIIFYGISIGSYVLPTPVGATYVIFFLVLILLFYLEGLMIAIVATQYWDKETWKDVYPRAYMVHEIINRPDNVKRFIIGRQFCTVLTGFLLAQITTFHYWSGEGFDKIGFFIIVQSGLVGVMVVLAFGQLCPELLAQEYPLRFMNLPLSYSVCYASLFFDGVGVGHAAWAFYYASRNLFCKSYYAERMAGGHVEEQKPSIIRVDSAEVFAASPSALKEYRDRINEAKSPRGISKK